MRAGPAIALTALLLAASHPSAATPASKPAAEHNSPPRIPDLFDPNQRLLKPDVGAIKSIRFLTTDDFPPFHFALADGTLAGFDIDLARAICADVKIPCTIQARRFETLVTALKAGEADALIAAVANTPATREKLAFTAPYYTTPGRFVMRSSSPFAGDPTPEALAAPHDRRRGRDGARGVPQSVLHKGQHQTIQGPENPARRAPGWHGRSDLSATASRSRSG